MGWRRAFLCLGLLIACDRPVVPTQTSAPASTAAPRAAPTSPAFLVYLDDQRTLVMPTAGGQRGRTVDGLWLPTPDSVVRYGPIDEDPLDAEAMLLEVCAYASESCDVSAPISMTFEGAPRLVSPTGEPCACAHVPGVSDDPAWEEDAYEYDDEYDDEDPDDCPPAEAGSVAKPRQLVAVMGGTIHFEESRHTGGCAAGMPAWTAMSVAVALSPSYPPKPMLAPQVSACTEEGVAGMDNELRAESPERCSAEVEYPKLASGRRARFAVGYTQDSGASLCCAVAEPLSPETCPSALDPCGQIGAGEQEPQSDYWVSTDGSYLLVRQTEVLEVRGRREQSRFETYLEKDVAIAGVHFVADASTYLDAVGPTPKWRYVSPEAAAQMSTFDHTTQYVQRAEALVAGDRLDDARRTALAGLGFEDARVGVDAATHYRERIELLSLLERIAIASDDPAAATDFRHRVAALRRLAAG